MLCMKPISNEIWILKAVGIIAFALLIFDKSNIYSIGFSLVFSSIDGAEYILQMINLTLFLLFEKDV